MLRIVTLILFLLFPLSAEAVTYYVDFAGGNDANNGTSKATPWKRIRGMTGATGNANTVSLVSGDQIIFKGGITWDSTIIPWALVGGSSAQVKYTTDHSWFTGASWTKPLFDLNHSSEPDYSAGNQIRLNGTGYVWLDDLKVANCGNSGSLNNPVCIWATNTHDISITRLEIDGYAWIGMLFNFDSALNLANWSITDNEVYHTASMMWFASTSGNAVQTSLEVLRNRFHDPSTQIGCAPGGCEGAHGDGLLHYFSQVAGTPGDLYSNNTTYVNGLTLCNNMSYGDFRRGIGPGNGQANTTMLYYQEGAVKNLLVCNNVVAPFPYENTDSCPIGCGLAESWIGIRDHGNTANGPLFIMNNSFAGDTTSNSAGSIFLYHGPGVGTTTAKNNIMKHGEFCAYGDGVTNTSVTLDYNQYTCPQGFNGFTPAGTHSLGPPSNPLFVATGASFDYHLTATSPGRNVGTNLSGLGLSANQQAILNADILGVTRPSGATAWDIGAYQFSAGGGGDVTPPSTPTNLRLVGFNSPLKEIDIAWDASTDDVAIQNYALESCAGVGCSTFTFLSNTTSLAFSEFNKLVNFSYSYRLRARDTSNNLSAYSSTLTVTTPFAYYHPTLNLTRR